MVPKGQVSRGRNGMTPNGRVGRGRNAMALKAKAKRGRMGLATPGRVESWQEGLDDAGQGEVRQELYGYERLGGAGKAWFRKAGHGVAGITVLVQVCPGRIRSARQRMSPQGTSRLRLAGVAWSVGFCHGCVRQLWRAWIRPGKGAVGRSYRP
jgi:hypothetical protein